MSARRVPPVTLLLIGANILAAFALFIYPDFAVEFGFRAGRPQLGVVLSSLFLHANLLHLLGNMVFLAAVGASVELATGSLRFAIVYFASGIAGVALHGLMLRHVPDAAPLIGASGCIAGCAAYYSVRYTRMRVPLAPKVALSVATVTLIWLFLQVVGGFFRLGDAHTSVSYWAHVGGFAMGALLSFVFRAPDFRQIQLGHEVLDRMNDRGPAALEAAAEDHLSRHPRDVKALWDLADARHQQGEADAEAEVLLRILEVTPEEEHAEALGRLCARGRITRISPLRRLQLADRISATAPAVAKAMVRSVVEGSAEDPQRPDALLTLAAMEREPAPEKAESLLRELSDKYPLHPATESARKRGWIS